MGQNYYSNTLRPEKCYFNDTENMLATEWIKLRCKIALELAIEMEGIGNGFHRILEHLLLEFMSTQHLYETKC